ncbi:hypothetical protein GCM10010247_44010 [Streptomyces calvus]|jgi:LPXTG-motif cell wall-anchored protein|nr:hypothetical protein GCM10010247_44010 [Streptomyces calvus]
MKLRRAMAAAAATAVIAPVALLAAPAAYATDTVPATSTSTDAPATGTPGPSGSPSAPESTESTDAPAPGGEDQSSAPSTGAPTTSAPAPSTSAPSSSAPAPTTSAPEDEDTESPVPMPPLCEDLKVDVSVDGLPGKISADGKWREFSLNVLNNSDSVLKDLDFLAGASADADGWELFEMEEIKLQAYDPDAKAWDTLDEGGEALGYVGYTPELEPDYEVSIPMRIMVTKAAPIGAGFSFGATVYSDAESDCLGYGYGSYKFQIVAPGTKTDGTKPQEGGKAPVTDKKPSANTPEVTGSLAETGSNSALPMIGMVGAAAVVAGAGAVFVVRRRKAGAEA